MRMHLLNMGATKQSSISCPRDTLDMSNEKNTWNHIVGEGWFTAVVRNR